jgi:hypothetical protein
MPIIRFKLYLFVKFHIKKETSHKRKTVRKIFSFLPLQLKQLVLIKEMINRLQLWAILKALFLKNIIILTLISCEVMALRTLCQ